MPEILKNEEEFRNEQAKKTAEFLDRSDAYEYFQNILSKKEEVPDFKNLKILLLA